LLAKNEKLQANLNALSFQEASGLTLKQLSFSLSLDRQHLNIENFNFKFNHSSLAANLSARYSSIDDFIKHPENSVFAIDLSDFSLEDRKSTRLNSSHVSISYAVFCLKTKE